MDELRRRAPALSLVTDRTQSERRDLVAVVRDCVGAGLPAVQLREKDLAAADLAALARRLRAVAPDALLIVNDRVDVALAVGADGVQRTSVSLPVEDIRTIAGDRLLIGASVHSLPDAMEAEANGADWIVFGPVYDTASKRRYGPPQGLGALEQVAAAVRVPVIAIGGITPERVEDVCAAGAAGVAVISAILSAPVPADATRRFLDALAAAGLAPAVATLRHPAALSAHPRSTPIARPPVP